MMDIKKITPEPECYEMAAETQLEWLCEGDNHALQDTSFIIRLLVKRVNELAEKVNEINGKLTTNVVHGKDLKEALRKRSR